MSETPFSGIASRYHPSVIIRKIQKFDELESRNLVGARRFYKKFMGLSRRIKNNVSILPWNDFSRDRTQESAIKTVMRCGLASTAEDARVFLEGLVGKDFPIYGDSSMSANWEIYFQIYKETTPSGKEAYGMVCAERAI